MTARPRPFPGGGRLPLVATPATPPGVTRPSHRGPFFDLAVGAATTLAAIGVAGRLGEPQPRDPAVRTLVVVAVVAQGLGALLTARSLVALGV